MDSKTKKEQQYEKFFKKVELDKPVHAEYRTGYCYKRKGRIIHVISRDASPETVLQVGTQYTWKLVRPDGSLTEKTFTGSSEHNVKPCKARPTTIIEFL